MLEHQKPQYPLPHLLLAIGIIFMIATPSPALANDRLGKSNTPSTAFSLPIKFFQRSISKADGDRCPMYPSCSSYASKALKDHGTLKGWILSCDRLLRCGHDEIGLSPKIRINGKTRVYDPVKANTHWWSKKNRERN